MALTVLAAEGGPPSPRRALGTVEAAQAQAQAGRRCPAVAWLQALLGRISLLVCGHQEGHSEPLGVGSAWGRGRAAGGREGGTQLEVLSSSWEITRLALHSMVTCATQLLGTVKSQIERFYF